MPMYGKNRALCSCSVPIYQDGTYRTMGPLVLIINKQIKINALMTLLNIMQNAVLPLAQMSLKSLLQSLIMCLEKCEAIHILKKLFTMPTRIAQIVLER